MPAPTPNGIIIGAVSEGRGFSLVEASVAAVILAVGLLAAAASSRAVTRLATLGDRYTRAAQVASSRLERLRGLGCGAAGSGSASHGAVDETWSASGVGSALAAAITVTFVEGGRARMVRYAASIPCRPGAP